MKAPAEQSPELQCQTAAQKTSQQQNNSEAEFQFIDNRAETASLPSFLLIIALILLHET